jgi:CPA2 family monovalent cation:H+ antiporter-2
MEIPILKEVVIIFGLSIGVIILCHRLRIPPIIGFLLTGLLAGPHGLGLVQATHEVEMLAEIGVILLLFVIGLEMSFDELLRLRKPVFLGGGAQVLLTIMLVDAVALFLGASPGQAIFFGFLAALSSTAIVLKMLNERAELNAPHGRVSLGILIFQDIIVVPMMLLVPLLAGQSANVSQTLLLLIAKSLLIAGTLYILAKKVLPWVLYCVVRTRSRELFLMTTLGLCFSIALLTSKFGLSLSLGAFLAGLLISESEYSLNALEGILPFRDVFTSLFFISIGMLLNVGFFLEHILIVAAISGLVILVKGMIATGAGLIIGYPLRVAAQSGLGLGQVGEFSFVLAGVGGSAGLIAGNEYQLFLAASILTMALTPVLIAMAPKIADRLPWGAGPLLPNGQRESGELEDHLIIVGFGIGGRHLARAAQMANVRYVIIEMNPDTVRQEKAKGEPIFYGDAAHNAVLEHAGIRKARILAIVIADPAASRHITDTAHRLNPGLHIVARTRFVSEIEPLRDLGAKEVVPEEFETSVEIFNRVLSAYLVPRRDIERFTSDIRAEGYGLLRRVQTAVEPSCDMSGVCSGFDVVAMKLDPGAFLDGKSLEQATLRKVHGLNVVAVQRKGEMIANPEAGFVLQAGDVVYVFAEQSQVVAKGYLFTVDEANGKGRGKEGQGL